MVKPCYDLKELEEIAREIRVKFVKMIASSGVGHGGGASSITEILTSLYFHVMNYNPQDPLDETRDRLVLSKGHGCPALYAALMEVGYLSENLIPTLHQIDSPLQMHPERGLCPGIEMSTGSLGQGMSAAVGMALGSRIKKCGNTIYVICSDGEMAEGQVWEGIMTAGKYKLENLTAILDYNKFTLTSEVANVMSLEPLDDKLRAFGWNVFETDGHSIGDLIETFDEASKAGGGPNFIIANTIKGYKLAHFENKAESHSITLGDSQTESVLRSLGCPDEDICKFLEKD